MCKGYVFVDSETDGLYGGFISVAMAYTDKYGNILESLYIGLARDSLVCKSEWVIENVIPVLGEYKEVESEIELLDISWNFWLKHRKDSLCIADVPFPVEFRLFKKCVEFDTLDRENKAQFPLLDLSSMLFTKGIDPLIGREELCPNNNSLTHNAMYDVIKSVEIWKKYIRG